MFFGHFGSVATARSLRPLVLLPRGDSQTQSICEPYPGPRPGLMPWAWVSQGSCHRCSAQWAAAMARLPQGHSCRKGTVGPTQVGQKWPRRKIGPRNENEDRRRIKRKQQKLGLTKKASPCDLDSRRHKQGRRRSGAPGYYPRRGYPSRSCQGHLHQTP